MRQVLVLTLTFRLLCRDSLLSLTTDASLYMIPNIPSSLEATCTMMPVPARSASGRGLELALTARKFWRPGPERYVCLYLHDAGDEEEPCDRRHRPVGGKAAPLPEASSGLYGGCDLLVRRQGLLGRSLTRRRLSVVDVSFIKLPDGYRIAYTYPPAGE